MTIKSFQYFKPGVLPSVILMLGTLVSILISKLIPLFVTTTGISYYHFPTAGTVAVMLLWIVTEFLWDKKPFVYLFNMPVLQGRYEGYIYYIHPISGHEERKKCAIEIIQSGSKVKVNSYFQYQNGAEKSPSTSMVETIKKEPDGSYTIVFTYLNKGIPGKFQEHSGTNILRFIKNDDGQLLKGDYYTNREPQTKGRIKVKFISKKIKNDY